MDQFTRWYRQTCTACPEQYEGQLSDGRYFYFRYRFGVASLGLSWDSEEAAAGNGNTWMEVGGDWDGIFYSTEERDKTFVELVMKAIDASTATL